MALLNIFKTFSQKEIANNQKLVDKILALDEDMQKLTDKQLQNKTKEFKERLKNGESLDDLLVEAFATVREASDRVLGMKHYPVQLLGGIVLHNGQIAEMKTGEGKTLVETLPAYLNALDGKGVHVVTVNDYLAKRDQEWMGKVYSFLGLTVGCIIYGLTNSERQKNYNCDITYGTNNQFGFDYLRDNMVIYKDNMVQRGLHYAIVDEVDSILIDEARTPLIISGEGDESTDTYKKADEFIKGLEGRILDPNEDLDQDPFDREFVVEKVDFLVDEKRKSSNLTEQGTAKAEKFFGIENLSDPEHLELAHYINNALKANTTMTRDIDYVVNKGEVMIVDEFTGRIMQGRRYSDGLHQAIEAKEGVEVQSESKTLATITFQNYFRMYDKLSGMTGTAKTEEEEFSEIYNLDVVEIPTNRPIQRVDDVDYVYINENGKYNAIIEEIKKVHATGQPILVGTISIENSEKLSNALKKEKIKHVVLNAKNHEREADIVAQAGRLNSVTIATNMAGRGTDIMLGGNADHMAKQRLKREGISDELLEQVDSFQETDNQEILDARKKYKHYKSLVKPEIDKEAKKVREVGGLYIIGSERHESRRIDNQLRGRSGRQGDPGKSRFFISLKDDLIRLNVGEQISKFVENYNYPEDEPIVSRMVTRSIEKAQTRVEANNFATRKRVLQYDDVMNKQRTIIYNERKQVLYGENMRDSILSMIKDSISQAVYSFTNPQIKPENWEMVALLNHLKSIAIPVELLRFENINDYTQEKLIDYIYQTTLNKYEEKEKQFGEDNMREVERVVLLRVIDTKWMEHIDAMDQMRKEIGVRAMGNDDPVRAYTNSGFEMYEEMTNSIQEETVRLMMGVEIRQNIERKQVLKPDEESVENAESPDQATNRAERRRLKREAKKGNIKGN
ncbi:preprotein translocase subunit SecA [Anaerococcus hydrogenalis]|uniref:Protein translocase subunit SecA n=1 Tax=Anaerococcus hydrogenalis TaxID=33029 RepID=A0A2N6UJQ7_9FIRM|nr:preprotein translocase subunit SecA [Anaerococcus hydrogenalis]MDK7695047.1 preprotein translocase subunit SecA [Anaerococcus hydrogenalis]MDK7696978.1 preprotein translocase subunit SecA [Anaerococcus hydrogenalis]MDK7708074.1 preprotein translocase subunit SecA [Anaerococcus hydrogenalis]PMC81967.1 preprotein translocase subunit SecA [Anaerococcus hydrogenalis]